MAEIDVYAAWRTKGDGSRLAQAALSIGYAAFGAGLIVTLIAAEGAFGFLALAAGAAIASLARLIARPLRARTAIATMAMGAAFAALALAGHGAITV